MSLQAAEMNWRNVQHTDPLLGKTLDDRFRIEGLLGQGGMGRVYEGRQLSVDRPVAIKIIRKGIADSDVRDRFMREARVLSGLSHPNLVRLIDFGIQDERPYLVMEKVGGIALGNLLERGRLRASLALEVVKQMGAGLAAAHAAGVVHRDLKPENIHLVASPDGTLRVKILDFGIAFPTDTDERLTKTGQVNGTPRYMAPEQAKSGKVDYQADLYSVGVILYEMLTGRPPFDADSTLRVMMKHVRETPAPVLDRIPATTLPSGLEELVDQLLAKVPSDRPKSARAVRKRAQEIERHENLEQIEVGENISIEDATSRWVLGPEEIDPTTVEAAQSRSRRHLLIGSGTALGIFALILLSYLGFTQLGASSEAAPSGDETSSNQSAAKSESETTGDRGASANEPSTGSAAEDSSESPSETAQRNEPEPLFEWPPSSEETAEEQEPAAGTADAGSNETPPTSADDEEGSSDSDPKSKGETPPGDPTDDGTEPAAHTGGSRPASGAGDERSHESNRGSPLMEMN